MFLYIIRHGQSVNNAGASEPDPVLTDLGHEQARRARSYLKDGVRLAQDVHAPEPEIVMSSAMRRALQTAHHISDAIGVESVYVRHDVHERTGPQTESLVRSTIHSEFPSVELDPGMPDDAWWPLERESEDAGYARGRRVARWLREKYARFEGSIALVTHGLFGHHFTCSLLGHPTLTSVGYAMNNCGISIIHITNEFTRTWCTNGTTHLEVEQRT